MEESSAESTDWINMPGKTLLWYAVYHANVEVVKYLITCRKNFEINDEEPSLLLRCIRYKHELTMDVLDDKISNRSDLFHSDNEINNLFYDPVNKSFVKNTYLVLGNHLLDMMPKVTQHDMAMRCKILMSMVEKSNNALRFTECFNKGNKSIGESLYNIKHGELEFIINAMTESYFWYEENTPLNQAIFDNNLEIAEILLKHGANPNTPIRKGSCNSLIFAAYHGNSDLMQLLLRHHITIDKKCEKLLKTPHYNDNRCIPQVLRQNLTQLLEYYKINRPKIMLLALFREFGGDNLLSYGRLPLDMFRVILGLIIDPDAEFLAQKEEKKKHVGFLGWLRGFLG